MTFKTSNKKNLASGGFTLIELLVVISIIGLLASVVLVALNSSRQKSRDAKRLADITQLSKAMELYFNENFSYPTTSAAVAFSSNPATLGEPSLMPKYLTKLPTAPSPNDTPCNPSGQNSNDFYMLANVAGTQKTSTTYVITFCLGNQTGSISQGPHTLTQAGIQ